VHLCPTLLGFDSYKDLQFQFYLLEALSDDPLGVSQQGGFGFQTSDAIATLFGVRSKPTSTVRGFGHHVAIFGITIATQETSDGRTLSTPKAVDSRPALCWE
jgi:hypothetical protein